MKALTSFVLQAMARSLFFLLWLLAMALAFILFLAYGALLWLYGLPPPHRRRAAIDTVVSPPHNGSTPI